MNIGATTTIVDIDSRKKTPFQRLYLNSDKLVPTYSRGVILELRKNNDGYLIRILAWDDDSQNIGMYYGVKLTPTTLIKDVSHFTIQVNR